jgi:hypothetical protein
MSVKLIKSCVTHQERGCIQAALFLSPILRLRVNRMEVVVVQVTRSLVPLARARDLYVVIHVLADHAVVLFASACRLRHRLHRPTRLPQVARLAEPDPLPRPRGPFQTAEPALADGERLTLKHL